MPVTFFLFFMGNTVLLRDLRGLSIDNGSVFTRATLWVLRSKPEITTDRYQLSIIGTCDCIVL